MEKCSFSSSEVTKPRKVQIRWYLTRVLVILVTLTKPGIDESVTFHQTSKKCTFDGTMVRPLWRPLVTMVRVTSDWSIPWYHGWVLRYHGWYHGSRCLRGVDPLVPWLVPWLECLCTSGNCLCTTGKGLCTTGKALWERPLPGTRTPWGGAQNDRKVTISTGRLGIGPSETAVFAVLAVFWAPWERFWSLWERPPVVGTMVRGTPKGALPSGLWYQPWYQGVDPSEAP